MDLAWNPLGAVGIVVGLLSCALAVVVWGARSSHEPNRLLAAYLFCTGLYSGLYNGVRLFAVEARGAYALVVAGTVALGLAMSAYVLFLGTLDSPLVRWTKRSGARWLLAAAFWFLAAWVIVRPADHVPGLDPLVGFPGWAVQSSPLRGLVLLGITAVFILSAAPALDAWRRTRTALARRQARIFAFAFVLSSIGWASFTLWYLAYGTGKLTTAIVVTNFAWQGASSLVLTLGLAYGILKTQLFDIDLRLKWTLKRGTLVTIFLVAFAFVTQITKSYVSSSLGWLSSGVAAAFLLLLLRPIERGVDRLTDRAMPKVNATPAYKAFRKMEVYKAAVEELSVGGISAKERRALDALRGKLGIAVADARAMERGVRSAS